MKLKSVPSVFIALDCAIYFGFDHVTLFVQQMHWRSLCMKSFNILFYIYVTLYLKGIMFPTSYVYHTKQNGITSTMRWIVTACFVVTSVFPVVLIVTLKHLLRQNLNLKWESLLYLPFIS